MNGALLVNLVAFQVGWFACVLGGAHGLPWLGVVAAAVLIAVHLWRVAQPRPEIVLILLAAGLGLVFDSLLVTLDLTRYPSGMWAAGLAPYWIIAMWMMFATTLNVTFRWLKNRYRLAVVLGALAGPLSYYGGAKLGGVVLTAPVWSLLALALVWGVAMPLLMALSNRYDGTAETVPAPVLPAGSARAETPE